MDPAPAPVCSSMRVQVVGSVKQKPGVSSDLGEVLVEGGEEFVEQLASLWKHVLQVALVFGLVLSVSVEDLSQHTGGRRGWRWKHEFLELYYNINFLTLFLYGRASKLSIIIPCQTLIIEPSRNSGLNLKSEQTDG